MKKNEQRESEMRRALLTLMAAAMAAITAMAADVLLWGERELQWSDFRAQSSEAGEQSSLYTELDVVDLSGSSGAIAVARVLQYKSHPGDSVQQTAQRLRYHRLQFDQLEIARRSLQSDINSGTNAREALAYHRNLYAEQLAVIDEETAGGSDEAKLQQWEYFTAKSLEEIGTGGSRASTVSDFSYGVFIGLGGLFTTGEVNDYFKGCFTFSAGLTGGYKDLKLKALVEYGQPRFNEPNVYGLTDGSGRDAQSSINTYASLLGVSASVGYTVFSSDRFAVTPHVGFLWSRYGWNVANLEWSYSTADAKYEATVVSTEDKSLNDFNWMAGIDFDIKVHTYTSKSQFLFSSRSRLTSMVRITPYIARASYSKTNPAMQGYQIGFTVSYVGLAQALK